MMLTSKTDMFPSRNTLNNSSMDDPQRFGMINPMKSPRVVLAPQPSPTKSTAPFDSKFPIVHLMTSELDETDSFGEQPSLG